MKVLMLGWELPPHNSGGLGVACYNLCKNLSNRGVSVDFVLPYSATHDIDFMTIISASTFSDPKELYLKSYDSHKAMSLSSQNAHTLNLDRNNYEDAVVGLATDKDYDVIHAHDWLTFRAALRAQEITGKPLIAHVHSIESDRAGGKQGNPLVHEIEETTLLLADKVIAVSDFTKKSIIHDYNIPSEKIEVVHNSVDSEEFNELDSDNSYSYLSTLKEQGYKVVVNVGRLTIQKGLVNLLRAAKQVLDRDPKTIFLIVGDGEQYNELVHLSAQLGISQHVVFAGFQRGKKWRDAYGLADLFVMPSVSEPFGLTALEAVGYGCPVLLSRQSGVSEVLRHTLKVDCWDIDKMANQITSVVQNISLGQDLHDNSLMEFKKMSWREATDKVLTVYKKYRNKAALV